MFNPQRATPPLNHPQSTQSASDLPGTSENDASNTPLLTQRVELVAFPDNYGDALKQLIKTEHGRDCLSFRAEKLAPDVLFGESMVRCIWIHDPASYPEPEFQGIIIAIGERIESSLQLKMVGSGYTAAIDLDEKSLDEAAALICAFADHAAKRAFPYGDSRDKLSAARIPPILAFDQSDESIRFLAAAVEMLEIGVYVVDQSRGDIVTVWNREMERLFKQDRSAVLGKPLHEVFDDSLVCGVFLDMPTSYTRNRAIFPSKGINRSNFIADISKTQLHNSANKPAAIVGIIQDVTNRIHSENRLIAAFNELESSKDKLEQSNLEIRKGIEKAKKLAVVAQSSNKAKSYFLSNISHELRTPLNSIVSLTHALLEGTFGDLNAKQHEHLEIVSDSSKHLQSLINDILDLSKIELGKMNLKFAQTSIEDIARSSIRMIEQEASFKKVRCVLEVQTDVENIDADVKRLRQILLNLLVNAVKFTKPNTEVTLRITDAPERQSILFQVIDRGIGINEKDFAKIFSPFTQLDDSLSRQYEGTGLGLAIASKFVELHGGGLSVSSTPQVGSTFTIALPQRQPPTQDESNPRRSLAEVALDNRASRNLLLIVDENERAALHLKNQIERFTKLTPIISLPNEISAYHDQIAPKAIMVDLNVVGTHGADWINNAKRLPAWKKTKWIAIGSLDLPDNEAAATRLGFQTCSCKPISNVLLAEILK